MNPRDLIETARGLTEYGAADIQPSAIPSMRAYLAERFRGMERDGHRAAMALLASALGIAAP